MTTEITTKEKCARLRSGYEDQQAAGFMTLEELDSKSRIWRRPVIWRKPSWLAVSEVREELVEKLKKDRDALLESWAGIMSEALQDLTREERNRIYRMLRP